MSTGACPFWCARHDRTRSHTSPCRSAATTIDAGPTQVALRLVRPPGRPTAGVEVLVGAQAATVPLHDVQALINALRLLVGNAQRSGCGS